MQWEEPVEVWLIKRLGEAMGGWVRGVGDKGWMSTLGGLGVQK